MELNTIEEAIEDIKNGKIVIFYNCKEIKNGYYRINTTEKKLENYNVV